MNKTQQNRIMFVPGGPWISGKYWDKFINEHFHEFITNRVELLNHETLYNSGFKPSLDQLVHYYQEKIRQFRPHSIIAHSYGAWITILALKSQPQIKIENIILCNMPQHLERTDEFHKIVTPHKIEINNNFDFSVYFKNILSAYFSTNFPLKDVENLASEVYMEGNEGLIINEELVKDSIRMLPNLKSKVFLIFGENDLITGKAYHIENCSTKILSKVGHFPMIESHKYFSESLKNILN